MRSLMSQPILPRFTFREAVQADLNDGYFSQCPEPTFVLGIEERKVGHAEAGFPDLSRLVITGFQVSDDIQRLGYGTILASNLERLAISHGVPWSCAKYVGSRADFWRNMMYTPIGDVDDTMCKELPPSSVLALRRWLIILRGPPGVGKSTIADQLRTAVGEGATTLDLDVLGPAFSGFGTALQSNFVIAHVFSGQDRTRMPNTWIDQFRNTGFRIASVRLDIALDEGWSRLSSDSKRRPEEWPRSDYERLHGRFYSEPKLNDFERNAGIREALRISTGNKTPDVIVGRILAWLQSRSNYQIGTV